MSQSDQEILEVIKQAIGRFSNVEPEDISRTDHLEDELFMELSQDVPRVIAEIQQELDIEVDPDTITQFIEDASEDPQKATVSELFALVKEEVEFN